MSTTVAPGQQAVVVELRGMLSLPRSGLVVIARDVVNPGAFPCGVDR